MIRATCARPPQWWLIQPPVGKTTTHTVFNVAILPLGLPVYLAVTALRTFKGAAM
jgi:hypothetical protein